jgi:hypothetical protein
MSSIQLQGNSSGTGVMTVSSPNTNTNYTITLPQANTTLVGTDDTQTLTNKTISGAASLDVTGNTTLTGYVGIGGGTPGSNPKLSMYGGIRFLSQEAAANTYTGIGSIQSDAVSISCGALERMRIIPAGTMYLGYGGAAPVLSGADVQGLSLTSDANVQLQMYMLKAAQVECHIGFKSSADTNFYVGTGGGISGIGTYGLYQTNTGTTWTSVSDERFKTELQPIENALDKIANVRAVTGRYTYDEENGRTSRRPFLIAQDFVEALPEAVDQQDPDKLGLSYSDTIPLLVAAIKEQQELITSLTLRIEALETKG